jgi:predicted glycoside hydrolase/deacetylase ChbG (UPF0249 family)
MNRILSLATIIIAAASLAFGQTKQASANSQTAERSLAERLGYARDAKLLIVNGDDLGMAHSIDAASIKALESGLVTSGSVMVPCPWFLEIADYAKSHADADLGVHLTLTSEWALYRWGPVLPKDRVGSLFDQSGYLYPTEDVAAAHIDPREVEAELRAQIERARSYGIQPTHLDSHMNTLFQNKALFETLLRVARENHLPVRVSKEELTSMPFLPSILQPEDILIDRIVTIDADVALERWTEFYTDALKKLPPGVTEMVIHLAFDDEEMRAATINHPNWGAAWRQRDFDFFTSEAFRKLLEENHIKLIKWREIGQLLTKAHTELRNKYR